MTNLQEMFHAALLRMFLKKRGGGASIQEAMQRGYPLAVSQGPWQIESIAAETASLLAELAAPPEPKKAPEVFTSPKARTTKKAPAKKKTTTRTY